MTRVCKMVCVVETTKKLLSRMHVTDLTQYDKHLRRPPYLSSLKKIVERRNLQASINILPPVSSHFRQTQTSTHTPSILPFPPTHPSTHALPYTHPRAHTDRERERPPLTGEKKTDAGHIASHWILRLTPSVFWFWSGTNGRENLLTNRV